MLSLRPGDIIAADFVIERALSQGGMGQVFVARQKSTGKRRALKVMQPELVQDAKLRERFVREAQVGALIDSDHIVEVIAAGIDPLHAVPWLAMELLDGHPLDELCQNYQRLGLDQRPDRARSVAEEVLRQLCHGLAAAHRAGIVHRDLKPENIFLAKPRRTGVTYTVKILDFGIARIAAEARATATATIGSPFWMAPEQTQQGSTVTPATDVWAIGLITFLLLTGRQYWLSAGFADSTPVQVLRELVFEPLRPASARARELGIEVPLPVGFDAWFGRCVNREPAGRFPDAARAFEALAPMLQSPKAAPPPRAVSSGTIAAGPLWGTTSLPASKPPREMLLNRTKTFERLEKITDPREKAVMRYALHVIVERLGRDERPEAPFDLHYYCELVAKIFEDRETLDVLTRGDVSILDWLPE